ncbi:MAG: hypothetical protein AB7T07_12160 [Steroidobacteraceae bacterium]
MSFAQQLEATWPAQYIANSIWGFPILEVTHLLGITVVFGGMVLLDLRLLGLRRDISAVALERYVLPYVWIGFAIAAFSGGWLIVYEAGKLVDDSAFLLKMLLLPLAGLNALFMHRIAARGRAAWDVHAMPPLLVRLSAAISLLLWSVILACGRLIAYYYGSGI